MKYFSILILGLLSTAACIFNTSAKPEQSNLELILLNNEVHYVDIDSVTLINVRGDYSKEEIKNARNIISYKIINHSNKDQLLAFNPDELTRTATAALGEKDAKKLSSFGFINYAIKENGQEIGTHSRTPGRPNKSMLKYFYYKVAVDSIDETKFRLTHPTADYRLYKNYVANSFILHPGESKTFKVVLTLPIVIEMHNPYSDIYEFKYLYKDKKYDFGLFFSQDSLEVKRLLEPYELDDLKNNKVSIFNGRLISNEIPLKMVK
jgi:hypothetical protein